MHFAFASKLTLTASKVGCVSVSLNFKLKLRKLHFYIARLLRCMCLNRAYSRTWPLAMAIAMRIVIVTRIVPCASWWRPNKSPCQVPIIRI